jgi:gamma-glutamylcysteine synthetase
LLLLYIITISIFFFRIGTEHEKFGFEVDTLRPMKYEQIRDLLNGLSERFDWDKIMEGEYIIGLKQVNLIIPFDCILAVVIPPP